MKTALTLNELASELTRQSEVKQDFIVAAPELTMEPFRGELTFNDMSLAPTVHCGKQLATHTGIGTRYYEMMRKDSPALLAGNVNHWLHHRDNKNNRRMVREMDGSARAFLSDRYLRLDNDIVAKTSMAALAGVDTVEVASCDVTDKSLYIKALFPKVEGEVKSRRVGDVVQTGVLIKNSEIGLGSVQVLPFMHFLVCLNGMTINKAYGGMTRRHVGKRIDSDNVIYSQETIEKVAAATLSEMQDAIKTFTSQTYLDTQIERMNNAADSEKVQKPIEGVERLAKLVSLTDAESEGVIERFIRDQDYSRYGMMNAVTNLANSVESYDRASELEMIGGRLLDLNPNQWHAIAA